MSFRILFRHVIATLPNTNRLKNSPLQEPESSDTGNESEIEHVNMVQYLPIRPEHLQQLKTETENDEALQLLKTVIRDGWPEEKHELPILITPFYSRDELSIQDGIIFRGERVVVPTSLRTEMKLFMKLILEQKVVFAEPVNVDTGLGRTRI